MNHRLVDARWLVPLICGALVGCSDHPGRPATFPVRGKVIYQGKPVADASVAFLAPGAPRLAVGTTDDNGNFRLTTYDTEDGAIAGNHVVTVVKPPAELENAAPPDGGTTSTEINENIEQAMQQAAQQMIKADKAKSSLPSKYAHRNTSDLQFSVVEGNNDFAIELTD